MALLHCSRPGTHSNRAKNHHAEHAAVVLDITASATHTALMKRLRAST